jgi:hypothetical protein
MHKLALLIMREGNSLDEDVFEKDLAEIRKARENAAG